MLMFRNCTCLAVRAQIHPQVLQDTGKDSVACPTEANACHGSQGSCSTGFRVSNLGVLGIERYRYRVWAFFAFSGISHPRHETYKSRPRPLQMPPKMAKGADGGSRGSSGSFCIYRRVLGFVLCSKGFRVSGFRLAERPFFNDCKYGRCECATCYNENNAALLTILITTATMTSQK